MTETGFRAVKGLTVMNVSLLPSLKPVDGGFIGSLQTNELQSTIFLEHIFQSLVMTLEILTNSPPTSHFLNYDIHKLSDASHCTCNYYRVNTFHLLFIVKSVCLNINPFKSGRKSISS